MSANQPYDPRYNAKIYVPKLTEEQRRARATPLENLRSLRYRCQASTAPVEAPIAVKSLPQAPALQDVSVPEQAPAHEYLPTALEVVFAEFPEIFKQGENRANLKVYEDQHGVVSVGSHGWEHVRQSETTFANALDHPSAAADENDTPPAYSNIISFYRRPRPNATASMAMLHRNAGPNFIRPQSDWDPGSLYRQRIRS